MPWYKQLRWRLVATQFLVAFVGVAIMMLATRLIILSTAPLVIRPQLVALLENPASLAGTENHLILAFRNAVLGSVAVAAVGAITAGVISSYILWRTLIAPLLQMAESSQRIAGGRYGERVRVPDSSGQAMARLVISFNQMAAALEQVEQQRVTLLGNVAHELRTPLSGLKGYLEGVMDGLFPANEETFAWMSEEIERLNRLVDDIQRLSRIEAGQFALAPEEFDVTAVAHRVVTEMQAQARSKKITLTVEAPPGPIFAHADMDRVVQVMINLMANAICYTPEEGSISIALDKDNHAVYASIRDTGIGIPAEALPYVFERFYRVDQSRARSSGGSGIGLTISRHLVWAMRGEITATSEGKGMGAVFTFSLPLSRT